MIGFFLFLYDAGRAASVKSPTVLLVTSRYGPHRKHRSSVAVSNCYRENILFAMPLLSNGRCIIVYLAIVAQQQVYISQYAKWTYAVTFRAASVFKVDEGTRLFGVTFQKAVTSMHTVVQCIKSLTTTAATCSR
jgi:hypothetical protein